MTCFKKKFLNLVIKRSHHIAFFFCKSACRLKLYAWSCGWFTSYRLNYQLIRPWNISDYHKIKNKLGVYYTFNIALVSISVMASIIVLRLHFRGHKTYKLPVLFRNILLMPLPADSCETNTKYLESNQSDTCEHLKRNSYKNFRYDSNSWAAILQILKSIEKTNRLIYKEKLE